MEYMVKIIREYQYYEVGVLESMSEEELREVFERLLDWLG